MKNILITGTSTGVGLATAIELARRGQRVFASMRDTARAGGLLDAARTSGCEVEVLQLDVNDEISVNRAIAEVIARAGSIDVAVNNAAIAVVAPLEQTHDAIAAALLNTNVLGPLRVIRGVLPHFRNHGSGRIVNVSSGVRQPRSGIALWGLYAASKAALHVLSYELAKEVAPLGIDVVLVEGGVGGQSAVWEQTRRTVALFEGGPYRHVEEAAARQTGLIGPNLPGPEVSARMIADACLVESPPIRFPVEAQAPVDAWNRVTDTDFLRLANGEDPALVLAGYGFATSGWAMGRS